LSVLSRLKRMTQATLGDLRQRSFGKSEKPLSELSDAELEEELLRRRRQRARRRGGKVDRQDVSPQQKQTEQWYANLELEPGATLDDVKQAYRELMRKYHPDKHLGDPARHKAATELAQSLTDAYQALVKHLEK
jgi:DnaJ-domain-containing protein 1